MFFLFLRPSNVGYPKFQPWHISHAGRGTLYDLYILIDYTIHMYAPQTQQLALFLQPLINQVSLNQNNSCNLLLAQSLYIYICIEYIIYSMYLLVTDSTFFKRSQIVQFCLSHLLWSSHEATNFAACVRPHGARCHARNCPSGLKVFFAMDLNTNWTLVFWRFKQLIRTHCIYYT